MLFTRLRARMAAILFGFICTTTPATAEDWPERDIQLVVPFGAGGDTDFNARLLARYMEPILGVSMPVVNISGAAGGVGARHVLGARSDGYTVLLSHTAMLVNTATGLTNFSYEDFEVAAIVGREPGAVLVVHENAPWHTLDELMAASTANPGTINLTTNIGATTYLIGSMINAAGAAFNFVDVGGSAKRMTAILGGHVDVSQNPLGQVAPYLETGELRALATVASERSEALPDVLTFREQGYEDVTFQYVFFLAFPPGTDPDAVETLSAAAQEVILNNTEYQTELFETYSQVPFYRPSHEALEYLAGQKDLIARTKF